MSRISIAIGVFALAFACPPAGRAGEKDGSPAPPRNAVAQRTGDLPALEALKTQIDALKSEYEKRIKELETQVQQLQAEMLRAEPAGGSTAQQIAPAPAQSIPGALNPAISVIGNFVARADSRKVFGEEGARIDNKLVLREGEVDRRVPVDPYADGVFIASFEQERPGTIGVDIEEAYVNVKKLPFFENPPLGLRLKVGRFRPAFGSFNVLHTHDLPQSFRPLPVQEFLGPEGFIQNGISGTVFVPTPWDPDSSLDLTVQALGGGDVAISPDPNARNSYLAHLRWFRTIHERHNLELGASSYFRPRGNGFRSADMHGFNALYRWKPFRQGEWKSNVLATEIMFARSAYPEAVEAPEVAAEIEGLRPGRGKPVGFTVFDQWQFNRRTYAGVRYDQTSTLFDPALKRRSATPYLSYYFSEFLRLRLNFEHRWSDFAAENRRNSVYAELNWVFGSHPPEPFWVNR
jgi:hypothetical protein